MFVVRPLGGKSSAVQYGGAAFQPPCCGARSASSRFGRREALKVCSHWENAISSACSPFVCHWPRQCDCSLRSHFTNHNSAQQRVSVSNLTPDDTKRMMNIL